MTADASLGHLREITHHLRYQLTDALQRLDEVDDHIERLAGQDGRAPAPDDQSRLLVLQATFSVQWNGRTCALGNTLGFRFLARLARRPNQYISYNQLITDVWDGQIRSPATVRALVRDLRRSLTEAAMPRLAAAIKGEGRTYGLILDGVAR